MGSESAEGRAIQVTLKKQGCQEDDGVVHKARGDGGCAGPVPVSFHRHHLITSTETEMRARGCGVRGVRGVPGRGTKGTVEPG